jgi:hypothetical protein
VEGIVTLIVYYVVFMIVGDFAAYFLGLFTEYEWGLAGEPDRLSGSLFSFSMGVLGACCTGHQAKNGRAAIILTKHGTGRLVLNHQQGEL